MWSLEQWSQSVILGPAVVSECGPWSRSGLRVWSSDQQWSQSVASGPALVSECGPWSSSGLRVWFLDHQQQDHLGAYQKCRFLAPLPSTVSETLEYVFYPFALSLCNLVFILHGQHISLRTSPTANAQQPHVAHGSVQDGASLEHGFVSSAGDRRH